MNSIVSICSSKVLSLKEEDKRCLIPSQLCMPVCTPVCTRVCVHVCVCLREEGEGERRRGGGGEAERESEWDCVKGFCYL